jgi:hypothetical protein
MIKNCPTCNISKNNTEFYKVKNRRDGLFYQCKNCNNKYVKNYNKTHKKEKAEYRRNYYQEHKEASAEYQRNYNQKHKSQKRKWWKNKTKVDINFKILGNLRKRIWDTLKGNSKSARTMKLIGCSIINLRKYLQKQFKSGMNWKNYGKWHIDHIIPCSKFDLSKPKEQRKCFHYTNLQPLWAKDNWRKSDKL